VGISRIYTHDNGFWKHDPFDRDHSRKRDILRQTHLIIDAPYHPEYAPREQINPQAKKRPTFANGRTAEGD
jgi:hypothetical protein